MFPRENKYFFSTLFFLGAEVNRLLVSMGLGMVATDIIYHLVYGEEFEPRKLSPAYVGLGLVLVGLLLRE